VNDTKLERGPARGAVGLPAGDQARPGSRPHREIVARLNFRVLWRDPELAPLITAGRAEPWQAT
jgi:hypothetical protein